MPVNYQLGKIYTIVNTENDIVYVGSTAQKLLSSRMCGHRLDAQRHSSVWNMAMRTIGFDKFTIILHHAFPCNSKDELFAEENRTMDAIIASGTQVYNGMIQGKHSDEAKRKMAAAKIGTTRTFTDEHKANISKANSNFGSLTLQGAESNSPRWVFQYYRHVDNVGKRLHKQSFAVKKYGDCGARLRAEEARRAVYPEWGNDEDICCDDFGAIELD